MVPASSHPPPRTAPVTAGRGDQSTIDASSRAPLLVFLVFGALWLLLGTALAIASSLQLHNPGFLGDLAWLTYGRSQPATFNVLLYGWGFNVAFALALWLMARLSQAALGVASLAVVGGLFWNLGVLLGVAGILTGYSTAQAALEMPRQVAPILFAAYALIGVSALVTFRYRRSPSVYVSQWYLIAALFWFPWLYSIAQATVLYTPARGVVQAIGAAWYAYNVYGLWLAPIGLAAIYYLLPKLLGRPIRDYGIARMGFWSWGLFASWVGASELIGGPIPVWVQAAGTAAALMLLVPVTVIAVNHLGSLFGQVGRLKGSPTLSFVTVSAVAFLVAGLMTAALSLRSVAETLQFTYATQALTQLELYGFFSMAAFGAIYFIVPRLVRRAWPSGALITAHFWTSLAGSLLALVCLVAAGWAQGTAMNNPDAYPEYVDVVARTIPWLVGHSLALVLLAIGHIAFAVNLGLMLMKPRAATTAAPELFRNPPALEVVR